MPEDKRTSEGSVGTVRETDIEPYTGLRWVSTLFKAAAIFLAVALVGEFIAGLRMEGTSVLPTLLGELANTAVLAVVLWGGGDLVKLMVQLGNDVRAERVLLSRLVHRTPPRVGSEPEDNELFAAAMMEPNPEQRGERRTA
ncbi:MAG: hypothetical protein ACRELX_01775 [Longimicrobiales bacterium]